MRETIPRRFLVDTDVLIDYLRRYPEARVYFKGLSLPPLTSVICVAELYAGVKEGKERQKLEALLATLDIVPVNVEVAVKGGLYRRTYSKSHSMSLSDALIAASANTWGASLVTLNKKHFPILPDTIIPYQKS